MGAFLVYILKSAACLSVFYGFYYLLLSKETFHRFNRIALLSIVVLGLLLPAADWFPESPALVSVSTGDFFVTLQPDVAESEIVQAASFPFTWQETCVLLYVVGILFFCFRQVWALGRLMILLHQSRRERLEGGSWLVVHEKVFAPFSWMNYIVISEIDLRNGGEAILLHELAHIRNRHSWDLLFMGFCICLQWFNPIAWLLKAELQNIHEYEADEAVLREGIDARRYQLLLIEKAAGARLYSLANSFNHSLLKKRITMMIKKKSNPWARVKYLYILPLAAVTVAAFARPEISRPLAEISKVKVSDFALNAEVGEAKNPEILREQQEKRLTLRGVVREKSDGKPIMGASVLIKGTSSGTLTDEQGVFVLTGVPQDAILGFYMVGYKRTETGLANVPEGVLTNGLSIYLESEDAPASDKEITVIPDTPEQPEASSGEVFRVVEEMPEYPGGMQECLNFVMKNIKYPADALAEKIEGRVIVRFVVMKDGTIAEPEILRSVSPSIDAEALRVIRMMPKWKPGKQKGKAVNVKYTIPLTFTFTKAQEVANAETVSVASSSENKATDLNSEDVLIIIDGLEVSKEVMNRLSSDQIESVSVLKDKAALEQYGEKGKNGVILIKTKEAQK